MFGKKEAVNNEVINTVIGNGIKLDVKMLSGTGSIRIDGLFIGDMDIDGSLIIGETGKLEGTVKSKSALIAGKLDGNISCSGTLHVTSTGCITGNIDTASIVVDDGASFNGNCMMTSNAVNSKPIPNDIGNVKKFEKEPKAL